MKTKNNTIYSLQQLYPKRFEIPIVLLICIILLIFGLFLPIITLNELVFWTSTFSVVTGIVSLFQEEHYVLGLVILFFSVIFPIFKLLVLSAIWFTRVSEVRRNFYLHWLGLLGKWSMLDVFVVAVTIVITKISNFAKAQPRPGLYFFGASVLLTILVTEGIERILRPPKS